MAIFSCNGTITTVDFFLNTLYGCLLPLTFLTSLFLNPVIFYYNFKQRSSVGSLLFQLLALSDFITCLYQPIVLSVELWSPHVGTVKHSTSPIKIASTLVVAAVIFGSGVLTNLLALTRYIKIKYPFICIKRKVVVAVAVLNLAIFWGVMAALILTSGTKYFDTRIQLVWYQAHIIESMVMLALFGIQSLAATATSIATVYELRKGKEAEDVKLQEGKTGVRREVVKRKTASQTRGGLTILIMNLGNMTLVLFVVIFMAETLGNIDPSGCSKLYSFTVFNMVGFIPIALSALNPLIITFRSSGVRAMLLGHIIDFTPPLGDTTLYGRSVPSPLPANRKYLRNNSTPRREGSGALVIHNLSSILKSASTTSVVPPQGSPLNRQDHQVNNKNPDQEKHIKEI